MKHIHLIGILGSGMSSLALYCIEKGFYVTGSDILPMGSTQIPKWLPLSQYRSCLDSSVIKNADVIVYSTAIKNGHEELDYCKSINKNVLHRSELIGKLIKDKNVISVTGTHGKTTTSSLISYIFNQNKLNPSFLLGGKPLDIPNGHFNNGNDIILEADESDRSFLNYKTDVCVITNIESDHLEFHNNSNEDYLNAFRSFIIKNKVCIYNSDDQNIRTIINSIQEPISFYGFGYDEHADFQIIKITHHDLKQTITIKLPNQQTTQITSFLLGKYNSENIVAAWIVCYLHSIKIQGINNAIISFQGVRRRCQTIGLVKQPGFVVPVIDDYGHHPTECHAVLTEYKRQNKKIIHIFQPHKYSRTTLFFNEFVEALSIADVLILLDVYSPEETLCAHNQKSTKDLLLSLKNKKNEIISIINHFIDDDYVILFQGAGSISLLAHDCVEIWNQNLITL